MANTPEHPASRLAQLKELMGLTDREMANRLGVRLGKTVARSTLTNILCGRSRPGRDLCVAIQEEFGVPVGDWTSLWTPLVTKEEESHAA